MVVPPGEAPRLDGVIDALARRARSARPTRTAPRSSATCSRRSCCGSSAGTTRRAPSAARPTTPRSSCTGASRELLEEDFARHHDAAHYADALGVPAAALSRALAQVTGRTTKELITDRVMLEAARLLRFTDLTVGEVAHRAGFADPLYFSRAFKRRHGEPPQAYRDARAREVHASRDVLPFRPRAPRGRC